MATFRVQLSASKCGSGSSPTYDDSEFLWTIKDGVLNVEYINGAKKVASYAPGVWLRVFHD
jgi:hypothetical protein